MRSNSHKNKEIGVVVVDGVQKMNSAFQDRIATYKIIVPEGEGLYSTRLFFSSIEGKVKALLDKSLVKHTSVKVNFEHFSTFAMVSNDNQEMKSFTTKNFSIHYNYDFIKFFSNVESCLLKKMEEFQERDSGWTFLSNSHLEININKYQPLSGS